MGVWYAPPGGQAVSVSPSDNVIIEQNGVTRKVPLGVLLSSVIGIQGASSDDEEAQLFARGYQAIIRLDLLGITTSTTLPPTTTSTTTPRPTTTTSTTTTSTTTGAPGSPPAASIVFSNFSGVLAPYSSVSFSHFSGDIAPSSTINLSNFN